jgi:L-rhamnose mutarotase
MRRYGSVIRVKPEKVEEYKLLHANAWDQVLKKISEVNIRNYSIFLMNEYLFSYYEYVGEDYEADMARMSEDPITQKWWKLTDPCQTPIESAKEGEWWSEMDEVFHLD